MVGILRSLWQYRQFIFSSIRNEMISRFAHSKLGGLWMIISPLLQVTIYALILSNVLGSKLPNTSNTYAYAIYLMAGLLGWTLFNEIITRSLTLFIENGNLMKKVRFPRITLPSILTLSCLLNNILLFVAILFIFILIGQPLSLEILWLAPLTLTVTMLALSIGLIMGIINVFLRDIGHVLPIVLQVWFWFTPVVYPETVIPEQYRHLLNLNPMYHLIKAYHDVLACNKSPQLDALIPVVLISLLFMLFSLFLFRRASPEMVDVL